MTPATMTAVNTPAAHRMIMVSIRQYNLLSSKEEEENLDGRAGVDAGDTNTGCTSATLTE